MGMQVEPEGLRKTSHNGFARRRRLEIALGLLVLLTHAYFFNGTGWNQNVRLDSIFSFVEPGYPEHLSFRIDRFIVNAKKGINTGDWSYHDGHFYSSKPPGTTLLGVPAYLLLYYGERALGFDPTSFWTAYFNTYLLGVWICSFWTAIAAAFLLAFLRSKFPERLLHDLVVALAFAFGTLLFPYDSQIWGHVPAAAFLTIGTGVLFAPRHRPRRSACAGFLLGISVLMDYLALVAVIWTGVVLLFASDRRKQLPWCIAGGLPCLLFLLVYQKICFGSYLTPASAVSNPVFHEVGRLGGQFGGVSLEVLLKLLVSSEKGVLCFMPMLIYSFVGGFYLLLRGERQLVILSVGVAVGTLLLVSTYNVWHGGVAAGPRLLIVSLPYWCILLAGVGNLLSSGSLGRVGYRVFLILLLVSCFNMLVIATVTTWVPPSGRNPLYGQLYSRFFAGEISGPGAFAPIRLFRELNDEQRRIIGTWNLGELAGLKSLLSLSPLALVLAAGMAYLVWETLREQSASGRRKARSP